jgi:hypothetical protein
MRKAPGTPGALARGEEEKGMPARGTELDPYTSSALKRFSAETAKLGLAFHILAYYEEDTQQEASIRLEPGTEKTVYTIITSRCAKDTIESIKRSLPILLRAPLISFDVECIEDSNHVEGYRYRELSLKIRDVFRSYALDSLRSLSWRSKEFFLVIGWNGEYAMGEGGEESVNLPLLPAVVFVHTHPGVTCYPSARDIDSFAEFFASGGVAEFIVSRSCSFGVALEGPFTSECYDGLKEVASCIKKNEKYYTTCINELNRFECISAELL